MLICGHVFACHEPTTWQENIKIVTLCKHWQSGLTLFRAGSEDSQNRLRGGGEPSPFKSGLLIVLQSCIMRVVTWRGTPGLGITLGTCSLRGEPNTDPHIPLKNRTSTLLLQTPTFSLRVQCTEHQQRTRNERARVLFSVGCVDRCLVFQGNCRFLT